MQHLETLTSTIDATWFGAGLSPESQARLAGLARDYDAPTGARLLREGDETREFSLLIRGRVALSDHVPGRGSVVLMTVEPGDVFGWTALLPPFRATSTVLAIEPVRVLAFDGPRLRSAVRSDVTLAAGVYEQVLEAVARRLLATRHQLLDLYRSEAVDPW
jgi:CRP/FNR family transcriptional regulator, cyclic AMP receptor protein